MSSDPANEHHALLGPYQIFERIGVGGMSEVFRARHVDLGRDVALKILRDQQASPLEARARFTREVKLMASLSHPHLVKLFDAGVADGNEYLAMELVVGKSLDQIVRGGRLAPEVAVALCARLADALAHLHAKGILHRDIKPSNVLVSAEGDVKLADFGLSRWEESTRVTAAGDVVGTVLYLAPECLLGKEASRASDVWSLGAMFYHLLTGNPPVDRQALEALVRGTAVDTPPTPAPIELVPQVPPPVSALAQQLLAADPARRVRDGGAAHERFAEVCRDWAPAREPNLLSPGLIDRMAATSSATVTAVASYGARGRMKSGNSPPGAVKRSGPVVRSAASRPASVQVRTAGTVQRATALLVACVAVLGAVLLWQGRTWTARATASPAASIAPARAPVASAALAAPATAAQPRRATTSYFSMWRRCLPHIPALKGTRDRARPTLDLLRRDIPVDLGFSAQNWVNWTILGAWLEDPSRPAEPSWFGPISTVPNSDTEVAFISTISVTLPGNGEVTAEAVASIVMYVTTTPKDARCWLALGRLLEDEGEPGSADIAFRRGLRLLPTTPQTTRWPPGSWRSMARALLAVEGDAFAARWWYWMDRAHQVSRPASRPDPARGSLDFLISDDETSRPGPPPDFTPPADDNFLTGGFDDRPWRELALALGAEPARLRAVLESGLARPDRSVRCYVHLGLLERSASGDEERARDVWRRGLVAHPTSRLLRRCLADSALASGDTDRAKILLAEAKDPNAEVMLSRFVNASKTPPARDLGLKFPKSDPRFRGYEVRRCLEVGDAAALEARVQEDLKTQWLDPAVALDLLGAGFADSRLPGKARQSLFFEPFPIRTWLHAAGALRSPAGSSHMESFLAEAETRWPRDPRPVLVRSLWLSRRGLLDASLATLDRAVSMDPGRTLPAAALAEILARPLWSAQPAAVVAQPTPAATPKRTWPALRSLDRYVQCLSRRDVAGALAIAKRELAAGPRDPFWAIGVIRLSAGPTGDVTAARASLRYHGHTWALDQL